MNKCYFLGYYNNHSMYYIPALLFAWLYAFETKKYLRALIMTVVVWISAFLVWAGGTLVALAIMTSVFIITIKKPIKTCNYFSFWTIHFIFLISIFVLNFGGLITRISNDILNKGRSFDARIALWIKYIALIKNKWLTGHGVWDVAYRENQVGTYWGMHAHNMILEIMYKGGLVYLTLFATLVIVSGRNLKYDVYNDQVVSIAFLGWIICTLVEPFVGPFLMGMFLIAYYNSNSFLHDEL